VPVGHGLQVFYLLDPDANLSDTKAALQPLFVDELGWPGIAGGALAKDEIIRLLAEKDVFVCVDVMYMSSGVMYRMSDNYVRANSN